MSEMALCERPLLEHVGYMALVRRFQLDVLAPPIMSYVQNKGKRRYTRVTAALREEYYPPREDPGDNWTAHLEFALKREGVNLEILAALFRKAPEAELVEWVKAAPTGKFRRIGWFLAEWLLGKRLPLEDLTMGNYVPVLDDEEYYALPVKGTSLYQRRQHVINNLPGTPEYCPLVRRTPALREWEALNLDVRAAEQVERYSPEILFRAVQFLYLNETKSSFAIEHIEPDQKRTTRFVTLLREADKLDCYSEAELIRLQNVIVEDRYAAREFRSSQNYVGQSLGPRREIVHYVCPKPEDVSSLMRGWMSCCRQMQARGVHPVVTAAVAGFGFVFIHPFDDGNGRLHRFLIHHALAAGRFAPQGIVFPVSATMLKQHTRYASTLEAYSREILQHIEYTLDDRGAMTVPNETELFYRYPDLTLQAEALFSFIKDTIEREMVAELDYLVVHDRARQKIREVVDMPDRRLDLFVNLCLQGKGKLSKTKRSLFPELTDDECQQMEEIVKEEIAHLGSTR